MGGGKGGEGGGGREEMLVDETETTTDWVDDSDYSDVQRQHPHQPQPQHQTQHWNNGASGSKSAAKGGNQTALLKETVAEAGTSGGRETPSEDYEVVYVKDNVSVHPTQHANGRISGRLRLIKQGPSLFMTWIPYAQGEANKDVSSLVEKSGPKKKNSMNKAADRDRNLYTIRAISLAEMRSIRRHTPPIGWQYIIIVLQSGLTFAPLYFHNGGVREFLNTLNLHASLVRSAEDANVYLVNDIQDPLQRSLTSLDLTVSPAPTPAIFSQNESKATVQSEEAPRDISVNENVTTADSSILIHSNRRQRDPARDISLQVLEKFSLVTKFARDTTAHLFGGDSRMLSFDNVELDHGPAPRRLQDLVRVPTLGSPANPVQDSSPPKASEMKRDDEKKADEHASTNVGTFELVDSTQNQSAPLVWGGARHPPLGSEEWTSFMDSEGRVVDPKALKKRVFRGGLEPGLRPQVWKFLLGYFLFDSTYAEREVLMMQKREEYAILKAQWETVSEEQAKRFAKYRERKHRVEKDVVRTDRALPFYEGDDNVNVTLLRDILVTYSFYNFDLGYCQGMSDLLSPILHVIADESEAFWCFAALMERMAPNFHRDQNGMHSQLLALSKLVQLLDGPLHDYFEQADCLNYFFCFRWILIQFKREFDYDNVLRLWEVLWSHHLSEHFHLYICVALLKRHRRKIMDEQMEFDTLLKFINELSGHIPLESTLRDAEALCLFAGNRGVACIPPGTPPSLPTTYQS